MTPEATFRPMPPIRLPEPFDHPRWVFEVKHDGFRALAHISGDHCRLVSRNGHAFKHWPQVCEELAHAVTAHNAIIEGRDRLPRIAGAGAFFTEPAIPSTMTFFYAFAMLTVDRETADILRV